MYIDLFIWQIYACKSIEIYIFIIYENEINIYIYCIFLFEKIY